MSNHVQAILHPEEHQGCRRQHGRLEQESVVSNVGQVLDMSAGGVRIACRVPPQVGAILGLTLKGPKGAVTVKARTVWAARRGLFRHEVGLEFVDIAPEIQRAVGAIAMACRCRRAM